MPKPPIPVWLDCDPGHDDAFAILMAAHHPRIRLLGVSTVFGNAPLEPPASTRLLAGPTVTHFERLQLTHAARKTTLNASALLTAFSRTDVPVYAGAAKPSVRDAAVHAPAIHGESGIDGTDLLPPRPREGVLETYAVHAMAEALMLAAEEAERDDKPRPWLVATGALTNVAELLRRHPELVHRLAGLSIMGGAIGGGHTDAVLGKVEGIERFGNLTPWAEFNIIIDPEAAAEVFNNKELAAKTTMIPLDVTHLVLATEEVQKLLLYGPSSDASDAKPAFTTNNTSTTVAGNGETANGTGKGTIGAATSRKGKTPLRTMLVDLLTFFANTYRDVFGIEAGPPLHDPLAVAAVLGNDEIEFYDYDPRPLSWPMSPSQPQQQLSNGASKRSPEAGPATAPHRPCERFTVHVVTDGTHAEALAGMAQTGRTVATLLPPGQPGVRIPRGLDIDAFWRQLEMCVARADAANEAAGLVLDARY